MLDVLGLCGVFDTIFEFIISRIKMFLLSQMMTSINSADSKRFSFSVILNGETPRIRFFLEDRKFFSYSNRAVRFIEFF